MILIPIDITNVTLVTGFYHKLFSWVQVNDVPSVPRIVKTGCPSPDASQVKIPDMNKLIILAPLVVAIPTAFADQPKSQRTLTIEVPVSVRTEIYLEQSKAKTARKADRLTGSNTFTKARERREAAKPRRYVPRTIKAKVREEK